MLVGGKGKWGEGGNHCKMGEGTEVIGEKNQRDY